MATEYHGRLLHPLREMSSSFPAYFESKKDPKNDRLNEIKSSWQPGINYKELFEMALEPNNKILIPLSFGNYSHPVLRDIPFCEQVSKGQYGGKIALLHEVPYFSLEGYQPTADLILCRSRLEAELFPNNDTVIIGDSSLDQIEACQTGDGIGLFVVTAGSRIKDSQRIWTKALAELDSALGDNLISSKTIYVSDHPSQLANKTESLLPLISALAERHNLTVEVLQNGTSVESIAKRIKYAFVQESISTHLTLRRLGVESFYFGFITGDPGKHEVALLQAAAAPSYSITDSNRSTLNESYNAWIAETFLLDGKTDRRIRVAMREL